MVAARASGAKTYFYCRVSTGDQHAEAQLPDLGAWAERNGLDVPEDDKWVPRHVARLEKTVWIADSFTGKTMQRPGMDKLMEDLFAGKVSRVVVWRLDRLGRFASGLTRLFEELKKQRASLISIREGFDLATPEGHMMAVMMAGVSQFELEVRVQRQRAGIEYARVKQKRARELAAAGVSPERIAGELGVKVERIQKMIAARPGSLYWSGGGGKTIVAGSRVAGLIRKGLTIAEVCGALGISVPTYWRRVRDLGGLKKIRGENDSTAKPPAEQQDPQGSTHNSAPAE